MLLIKIGREIIKIKSGKFLNKSSFSMFIKIIKNVKKYKMYEINEWEDDKLA
jgi:hypothetical protein